MKKVKANLTISLVFISCMVLGQTSNTLRDSISIYFGEIQAATWRGQKLWSKNLYAPILLVNPNTREAFANYPDSANVLQKNGNVFTGILPNKINLANTSIHWSGTNWAMAILPLPERILDRINLLAHELYHVSQPDLGFQLLNPHNNHLDQMNGRIYLRLELEALKKAVQSNKRADIKVHLTHAFTFRKYRHSLYSGSDTTENQLELNEGLAEYTGFMISKRNKNQSRDHLISNINSFLTNPSFVRSFAYQTTPVYGYLLSKTQNNWNKKVTASTNLIDLFISNFNVLLPQELNKSSMAIAENYNGKAIIAAETEREEKRLKLLAQYKGKFIEQPHLDIRLINMNISFDPRNIFPLEDKGAVYPSLRITDSWGILTVEGGALMSPSWNKITVSAPNILEMNLANGEGWTLELNEGWILEKDESTGNYGLQKK